MCITIRPMKQNPVLRIDPSNRPWHLDDMRFSGIPLGSVPGRDAFRESWEEELWRIGG